MTSDDANHGMVNSFNGSDHRMTGNSRVMSFAIWPSKLGADASHAGSGPEASLPQQEMMSRSKTTPNNSVEQYYQNKGLWQTIARNVRFQNLTLLVIIFNAIWLAIDTDYNQAILPFTDQPVFQILGHLFCIFFCFEWTVRFGAFAKTIYIFKDLWFCLDTFLVVIMVLDTWILPPALYAAQGDDNQVDITPLNLMRLLRLIRITRFFRVFPELMILLKGMISAIRSVFFTLVLLVMVLYVFGIAFCQITLPSDIGTLYFSTVPQSMYHLLICGVMFDNVGVFMDDISTLGMHVLFLFLIFVFLTTFTLLNMLIGVLCEVVTGVAESEKEDMSVSFVKQEFYDIFAKFAESRNDDDAISHAEFMDLMRDSVARRALNKIDVNLEFFADFTEVFLSEEDDVGNMFSDDVGNKVNKVLSFSDFMAILLQLRGPNSATVKDLMNLQIVLRKHFDNGISRLESRIENVLKTLEHSDHGPRPYHKGQGCHQIVGSSPIVAKTTQRMGLPHGVSASDDPFSRELLPDKRSLVLPGTPDDLLSQSLLNPALSSQEDSLLVRSQNRIRCEHVRLLENCAAAMQNLEEKCSYAISNNLHESFQHLKQIVCEFLNDQETSAVAIAAAWDSNQAVELQERAEDRSTPATRARASRRSRDLETSPSTGSVGSNVAPYSNWNEAIGSQECHETTALHSLG